MMRLIFALPLLLLAACSPVLREAEPSPVVVEEEPVLVEAEAGAALGSACVTGDDDGIGGTGCQVD